MENSKKQDAPAGDDAFQFRMGLNDNKAGMEGLDKEKINKIIMEATKVDKLAVDLEQSRDLERMIVHIDMDAFYAAVEMRDNPELLDKPMAVGSMSMLSTSNYLARRFGVRAAMPGFIAKKLCPNLTIVPPNFDKYRDVSKQVREVLAKYDPHFLPMSLDEAYLDLTEHLKERINWPEDKRRHSIRTDAKETSKAGVSMQEVLEGNEDPLSTSPLLFEDSSSPSLDGSTPSSDPLGDTLTTKNTVIFGTSVEEAVKEMRFRIEQKTTLTASAGIAPNMMLAKVCSDKNKPNGQYRIPSQKQAVMDFIRDLPIRKVPGIGKVTEKMLKVLGITTCADLYQQRALLALLFSETSWHNFLHISMGLGSTHIERDGERKSMSTERTFSEMWKADEQYSLCQELCSDLAEDLLKEGLKGKTVTLKVKNVKFEVKTRAFTVLSSVSTEEEIFAVAKELLRAEVESASPQPLRLRLMGVRVSGFLSEEEKKHHQISIINFLKVQNAESTLLLSLPQKTSPTQSIQPLAVECPGESFFNKKRAAKENNDLVHPQNVVTDDKKWQLLRTPVADIAIMEPPMLSDYCEGQNLTCPVCFQKQDTNNLEVFNRHIDKCLSSEALIGDDGAEVTVTNNKRAPFFNDFVVEDSCLISPMDKNILAVLQKENMFMPQDSPQISSSHNSVITNPKQATGKTKEEDNTVSDITNTNSILILQNVHTIEAPLAKEEGFESTVVPKEAWQSCPAPLSNNMDLICPVCNLGQETTDLTLFNNHVDVCLNKGIIQELKKERTCSLSNNNTEQAPSSGTIGRGQQDLNTTRAKRPGLSTQQQPASKKAKPNNTRNTIDKFFK
ncbi:DNA polymerase kappa isoform X2 [Ambystoma mexicanum]|uniref:DNA polymerase kappa isoform X2 n=1 Tax=Ambystoma mexicanum TaxID=8296 RepID=UPI0037E946D0